MNTILSSAGSGSAETVSLHWEEALGEWSRSREIVPITGAGLGINFGLPSWYVLTERLCDVLDSLGDASGPSMRSEPDLMLKAFRCTHHLRRICETRGTEVLDQMRDALYKGMSVTSVGTDCLECCFHLARMVGIHVTLNFDDIFESYCNLLHDKKAIVSEFGRAPRRIEGQIDSYHVHGLIPFHPSSGSEKPRLVFDAICYVEAYADSLDRLSTALLYIMTNYRSVFLGLSMTDPNLLRVISLSRRQRADPSCWGIVFGPILPELKDVLLKWGLAVVDDTGNGKFDFGDAPRLITGSLKNVDQPEFDKCFEKFKLLYT